MLARTLWGRSRRRFRALSDRCCRVTIRLVYCFKEVYTGDSNTVRISSLLRQVRFTLNLDVTLCVINAVLRYYTRTFRSLHTARAAID